MSSTHLSQARMGNVTNDTSKTEDNVAKEVSGKLVKAFCKKYPDIEFRIANEKTKYLIKKVSYYSIFEQYKKAFPDYDYNLSEEEMAYMKKHGKKPDCFLIEAKGKGKKEWCNIFAGERKNQKDAGNAHQRFGQLKEVMLGLWLNEDIFPFLFVFDGGSFRKEKQDNLTDIRAANYFRPLNGVHLHTERNDFGVVIRLCSVFCREKEYNLQELFVIASKIMEESIEYYRNQGRL